MIFLKKRGFLLCSSEEAAGAGRVAPQKLTITAAVVQTVLPHNEANGNGGQDCFYPVPRFRRSDKWDFFKA